MLLKFWNTTDYNKKDIKGGITMSKKTMKILTTICSAILFIAMLSSIVFADSGITPGGLSPKYQGTEDIQNVGQKIMGIVNTVGVVVAVVIIMVLGIKYMMGSAEEKAEYKKTMMPYLIGAVLIFGATTIANTIYKFANGLNS